MDHTEEQTPALADTESAPGPGGPSPIDERSVHPASDSATADTLAGEPLSAASRRLLPAGARVDHFRIMRLLGRGGMGEVYLARDETLGRKVALKRIMPRAPDDRAELDALLREARAIARCNHPHIVTLFAVGDRDGTPYMAMEYLEGTDLAERLQQRPPSVAEALRVGVAVADALAEAHRHGVLHRDLKPANIMLPTDGRLRVVDFGLARLEAPLDARSTSDAEGASALGQQTGVGGTPGYMAPEQWQQAACTAATDVWALGVLLFEMCTGRRPFEGRTVYALAFATTGPEPAPMVDTLADVPPELAELIARCLSKDAAARPPLAEVQASLARLQAPDRPTDDEDGPFRGLEPFTEAHAGLFFGRDAELSIAVERLERAPILPLIGPSGAGKSSLVHAGLVPRLRERTRVRLVSLRPGPDPFAALARRLLGSTTSVRSGPPGRGALDARALIAHPGALGQALRALASETGAQVVLFVDQLEEAFTQSPPTIGAAFVEAVCLAADDPADPVRVVFTLREEFIGRVAASTAGRAALAQLMVVQRPEPGELVEILRRPLALVGYRFEDDDLPREMVEAVGDAPAGLALLEFAAVMLWHARDRARRLLTRRALDEIGGVAGVLARHADGVLAGLDPEAQRTARAVFLQLVTADDTRRAVSEADLGRGLAGAEAVVERLVDARLLTRRRRPGEHALEVELTHESLITHWARLRQWIDEGRDERRALREVEQAAALWSRRGRRASELWTDEALHDARRALDRASTPVSAEVSAFVEAGEQVGVRRRRRRQRMIAAVIGGLGLLAAALAVQTANLGDRSVELAEQTRLAEHRRDTARAQEAAALRASADSAAGGGRPIDARAMLRASLEIEDHPAARASWAALADEPIVASWPLGTYLYAAAFDPTGTMIAAGGLDGTLRLLDIRDGSVRMLRGAGDQVLSLAWGPTGRALYAGVWHAGHPIRWDLETGRAEPIEAITAERVDEIVVDPASGRMFVDAFDHVVWCDLPCTEANVLARNAVGSIAIAPGGRWLAMSHEGGRIELFDITGEQPPRRLAELRGSRAGVRLAFADDGRTLYAGEAPATLYAIDLTSGDPPRVVARLRSRIRRIAVSPNGRLLAIGKLGGAVMVVDSETGASHHIASHGYQLNTVAFDPSGRRLLSVGGGGEVRLTAVDVARRAAEHERSGAGHTWRVQWVRMGSDGETIYTGGLDRTVRTWSADGYARTVWPSMGKYVPQVVFLPGGSSSMVLRTDGRVLLDEGGGTSMLSDDPRLKLTLLAAGGRGQLVAAGGADAYRLAPGRAPRPLGWGPQVHTIEPHPDGETAIVVRARGEVSRRPLDGGPPLWVKQLLTTGAFSAPITPDGRVFYTSDLKGRLVAADADTGQLLAESRPVPNARLYDLELHPNGEQLLAAASDGRIYRIDPQTGEAIGWPAHRMEANDLALSGDGRRLASVSDDGTVRLFDVATGRPVWRAPLLAEREGQAWIATHRGWQNPIAPDPPAPEWTASPWGRAAMNARAGDLRGDIVCLIDAEQRLTMFDGDRQRDPVEGPFTLVTALPDGCLARRDDGRRLVRVRRGRPELLVDVARAAAGAVTALDDGYAVLTDEVVQVFDLDGAERSRFAVERDASTLARGADGGWLVGYRAGDFEVRSAQGDGAFRQAPITSRPSPVVRLLDLGDGLVVAGHDNGTVRLWGGRAALREGRLHGPIEHLAVTSTHVVAASALGQSLSWPLGHLTADRCAFLRSVWGEAPATWVGDRPEVRAPDPAHTCAPPAEPTQSP